MRVREFIGANVNGNRNRSCNCKWKKNITCHSVANENCNLRQIFQGASCPLLLILNSRSLISITYFSLLKSKTVQRTLEKLFFKGVYALRMPSSSELHSHFTLVVCLETHSRTYIILTASSVTALRFILFILPSLELRTRASIPSHVRLLGLTCSACSWPC